MNHLLSDLTHGVRRLRRAPAFAAIAILTLGLGIGVNTAIFSLVKTVLLQPLPYRDAERLVILWGDREKGERTWVSGPEVRDYREESNTFAGVAAYTTRTANLTGGQDPERVLAAAVTPNLFETLGVGTVAGRTFAGTADAEPAPNEVVLGHALWQRRFGGDRGIIGGTIQVDGEAHTVPCGADSNDGATIRKRVPKFAAFRAKEFLEPAPRAGTRCR